MEIETRNNFNLSYSIFIKSLIVNLTTAGLKIQSQGGMDRMSPLAVPPRRPPSPISPGCKLLIIQSRGSVNGHRVPIITVFPVLTGWRRSSDYM